MIGNQAACDAFTAQEEGGYTNDPKDPGNWTGGKVGLGVNKGTKYGISAAAFPGIDITNLTPDFAARLRLPYWNEVNGGALPVGVDLVVYDFGINAGPGRSCSILEAVLGTIQDGKVGPNDVIALAEHTPADLIAALTLKHEAYYASLPTFPTYGKGWDGRAERCRTTALAMLQATSTPPTLPTPAIPVKPEMESPLQTVEGWASKFL
jgi:lysozyme family protein